MKFDLGNTVICLQIEQLLCLQEQPALSHSFNRKKIENLTA